MNDVETTGQAFEEMQEQNTRLLQQLREKVRVLLCAMIFKTPDLKILLMLWFIGLQCMSMHDQNS